MNEQKAARITAPRLAVMRTLAGGPVSSTKLTRKEHTKCWQLFGRGLADSDGRGWRLTHAGEQALLAAQEPRR